MGCFDLLVRLQPRFLLAATEMFSHASRVITEFFLVTSRVLTKQLRISLGRAVVCFGLHVVGGWPIMQFKLLIFVRMVCAH
jgi:hypothetical protein